MSNVPFATRPPIFIPPDVIQQASTAIQTLMTGLLPLLVDLGPDERRSLVKMGDKSEAFVGKTMTYLQANPQYAPTYLDVAAMGGHLAAVDVLRGFIGPLRQITDMVEDSEMLSGSEAQKGALLGYEAFQVAARRNQPGAALIVDDLSARFPGRSTRSTRGSSDT